MDPVDVEVGTQVRMNSDHMGSEHTLLQDATPTVDGDAGGGEFYLTHEGRHFCVPASKFDPL